VHIALFAVNGGYTHTNLAIRCLRRCLAADGFPVTLIEHNLRDRTDVMLDALADAGADVYGFSCYIWNLPLMLTLAADLKAIRPDAVIWFGGPEVSYATERFAEVLTLLFSSVSVGQLPTSQDAVTVGNADMLRADGARFAYLLGVNEGEFPAAVTCGGAFNDSERQTLVQNDLPVEFDPESAFHCR